MKLCCHGIWANLNEPSSSRAVHSKLKTFVQRPLTLIVKIVLTSQGILPATQCS
jgi:hypothetical protein